MDRVKIIEMRSPLLFLMVFLSFSRVLAQEEEEKIFYPVAYPAFSGNVRITLPPYSYKKIDSLIRKVLKETIGQPVVLPPDIYTGLSLREKFTYHMINAENFGQNCNPESGHDNNKIYRKLTGHFQQLWWARRQWDFFKDNRDSVVRYMNECISATHTIGDNFKWVIVRLDLREMIPALLTTYASQTMKDHDILTALMLLMRQAGYQDLLVTSVYKKLFEDKTNPYSYVTFSTNYERQVTRCAIEFYNGPFVPVPAGQYMVGREKYTVNQRRKVKVDSFYIAKYETTNRQFAAFVATTGYVTDAERRHNGLIFIPGLRDFDWIEDSTACWKYPNGVGRGGIENKMDHPVTGISYHDAEAYCAWAGVRLPTLEEWEIACRAGTSTDFFFGRQDDSISRYANIWWGEDHLKADTVDGYMYTSPVGALAPNPWGLYDMYGNVFEFCTGRLLPDEKPGTAHARGGSWWCSAMSCHYFTSYNIGVVNKRASFSNLGFRVAISHRLDRRIN